MDVHKQASHGVKIFYVHIFNDKYALLRTDMGLIFPFSVNVCFYYKVSPQY